MPADLANERLGRLDPRAQAAVPASFMRARTASGTVMPGTSLWRNSAWRDECSGSTPTTTGIGERVRAKKRSSTSRS